MTNKKIKNVKVCLSIGAVMIALLLIIFSKTMVKIKDEPIGETNPDIQSKLNQEYIRIEEEMIIAENSDGRSKYEEYYAGAYIDNNQLIVCVTDEDKMGDESHYIKYKIVENSYNELNEVLERFGSTYSEAYAAYSENTDEYELLHSMNGFGINEEKNLIEVDIVDLNEDKKAMFEELFGEYDFIEFQSSTEKVDD